MSQCDNLIMKKEKIFSIQLAVYIKKIVKSSHYQIITLFTFYLLLGTAGAQDSKSLFQTANSYYQNKQFEEAEKIYLLLIKKNSIIVF